MKTITAMMIIVPTIPYPSISFLLCVPLHDRKHSNSQLHGYPLNVNRQKPTSLFGPTGVVGTACRTVQDWPVRSLINAPRNYASSERVAAEPAGTTSAPAAPSFSTPPAAIPARRSGKPRPKPSRTGRTVSPAAQRGKVLRGADRGGPVLAGKRERDARLRRCRQFRSASFPWAPSRP
jgi:hypothetical protein